MNILSFFDKNTSLCAAEIIINYTIQILTRKVRVPDFSLIFVNCTFIFCKKLPSYAKS